MPLGRLSLFAHGNRRFRKPNRFRGRCYRKGPLSSSAPGAGLDAGGWDEALVRHMFGDAGYEAASPPPPAPQPANLLKAVILLAQGEPVAAAAREAGCDPARVERLWAAMLHVLRTA